MNIEALNLLIERRLPVCDREAHLALIGVRHSLERHRAIWEAWHPRQVAAVLRVLGHGGGRAAAGDLMADQLDGLGESEGVFSRRTQAVDDLLDTILRTATRLLAGAVDNAHPQEADGRRPHP